jgi:predicted RNA binding protein YcfA (HicA-like mRNA interferase family)
MKVREVIKRLKTDGWYEDRMRGSQSNSELRTQNSERPKPEVLGNLK